MRRFGIKYQILMITLIPVFFIDLFFTYNHINNSIDQADELLQMKGQLSARQIAGAAVFDFLSADDKKIQRLLDQAVDSNDIVLASIVNQRDELIAKSVSANYAATETADYFYYRHPIVSPLIDDAGTDTAQSRQADSLGWVHLYISRQQLRQTTDQIIVNSITFFLSILLMAVILTIVVSRKITQPIIRLMDHMKHVETGQLGKPIEPLENNEIGAVQQGFNRMTKALLANRRHLNQRIQQATQQLSEAITDLEAKNRELGFARDEAQNANRTKSEFLANMSHEIRTPINGIKGFISLLSQSKLNSTQQKYAEIILKSTNDLTSIINEILDFSKMESGKLNIVEEVFDLHEVIEQTRDILFINILTRNIDLNLIIFSDTPRRVVGDKIRLKQILLNLIGNAIKFTDQGQVVIRVEIEDDATRQTNILISIVDSGIGISEQDQHRLFQAFSQVDSADNRRFAGTGLGLVISKNLATLMGGNISMQSTLGEGSSFELRLPLTAIEDPDPEPVTSLKPLSALIFSARKPGLMEVQTLFDRALVNTESNLIDNNQGIDPVRECIQRNLAHLDLIVFDLRHLEIDLNQVLDGELRQEMRVIVMHYDRSVDLAIDLPGVEFISVITTSRALANQLLQITPTSAIDQAGDRPASLSRVKTVLLVDDNLINLKLAGELIRLWGHRVVEADHAGRALELYKNQDFDLIILDIQMPDIDGITLLKMMREYEPDDTTPVVALTANILNQEAQRLLDLGFDYYLSKPIDEDKFRSLLDGDPRQRQPGPHHADMVADSMADVSVDYYRSLALSADKQGLLKQTFEILLLEIPDHQRQLRDALQNAQHDKLAAIAHKLQGVTCYASLPKLKQMLLAFQHQLAQENNVSLHDAVLSLTDELSAIKIEVEGYLPGMDG